jgi:adenylate cyclase
MTLRIRISLMMVCALVTAVLATAAVLAYTARQSLLAQTEADGVLIARLLSSSASFAGGVARDAEEAIGEQMVVEATIAAHLVAIGEAAGLSPASINAHLKEITERTVLNEFWITDEHGHAYLRTVPDIDYTFSPDPQQGQSSAFWPLLTGEKQVVMQEASPRSYDGQVFKYAGVSGIDKPRIVEVGYRADFLERLSHEVGLPHLVRQLVSRGNLSAMRVVDRNLLTLAYSAIPGLDIGRDLLDKDKALLHRVVAEGHTLSRLQGSLLIIISPIVNERDARVIGAAVAYLPIERLWTALRDQLVLTVAVGIIVMSIGLVISLWLARRVTKPVACITHAAAAIEAGSFDPANLDAAIGRADELGQLARVFRRMAGEILAREQRLKQEVQQLRIEINAKQKASQVAEITETDYFQSLQQKAREMRRSKA